MTTNHRTTRRSAIGRGIAAMAGAYGVTTSVNTLRAADAPTDRAIDAHVHVWTPDTARYPLAQGFSKVDMRPPSFTPEELLAIARPNGVDRIVLIQMSFYKFDNSYMLDTMRRFPGVFSGVGIVDSAQSQPDRAMLALAKQGVRGFRITAAKQPPDQWLEGDGMRTMWQCAAEKRLAICPLINAQYLPSVDAMCRKFPDTTVVIDHFARVGVDGEIREADLANLCGLARHKHTHVKLSAFYALGRKQAPYLDLVPMIRRLFDAYGPQRLMWATDCPYQVQDGRKYDDSIALVRDRLDFASSADRQWLLRRTAEHVFFS
ncbi:MAG TPA: amidohydrolase family protein [Pirellulales bacterium]|nr:amidohydrolase family protein [Pirellulales bacterium]